MDNLSNTFQNVISLTNIYQFLKSQTVYRKALILNYKILLSLLQIHRRDMKGFVKNFLKYHQMPISCFAKRQRSGLYCILLPPPLTSPRP